MYHSIIIKVLKNNTALWNGANPYKSKNVSDIFKLPYITYVLPVITCLCHVTLLNSDSSMELDSRPVEICQDSFVLLRAYSLGIESTFWSFGNWIFAPV